MSDQAPRRRRKRRRGEIVNINTSQLRFEDRDGILVAIIDGDFDILSLPEVEPGLLDAASESDALLINLSEVSYVDAAALALLTRLAKEQAGLAIACREEQADIFSAFGLPSAVDFDQALALLAD